MNESTVTARKVYESNPYDPESNSMLPLIAFILVSSILGFILYKNTRSFDDRHEGVTVFFESIECRQRNFPLLGLADPIDIPKCGLLGQVDGEWNRVVDSWEKNQQVNTKH